MPCPFKGLAYWGQHAEKSWNAHHQVAEKLVQKIGIKSDCVFPSFAYQKKKKSKIKSLKVPFIQINAKYLPK